MKRLMITFVTSLFCMSALSAALPPLYQDLREIQAILEDPRLTKALTDDQAIVSISRISDNATNGYDIMTNKCSLHVDVVYVPTKLMGPAKFELNFQEPVCK